MVKLNKNRSDTLWETESTIQSTRWDMLQMIGIIFILDALNEFMKKTSQPKVLFSIWNHHKCLSQLFLVHLNTYVMGQRPL